MTEFSFSAANQGNTVFQTAEGQTWLSRLRGMFCGDGGDDTGLHW